MEGKSVFEILDFVGHPLRTKTNLNGEVSLILEGMNDHVRASYCNACPVLQDGDHQILIHDAAVLAAYFGLPKDQSKMLSWEKMEFNERVVEIMNTLSANHTTSFTKLL